MNGSTMIRGPSTPFCSGGPVARRPSDRLTPHLAEDLLQLLGEAGTEIANLDAPDNIVCARLRGMLDRIETARMVVEA